MMKNIITLKTPKFQNSFYLIILFFIFSCSNNKYYDDKDITTILNLSITEFSSQIRKHVAIEFAPRLKQEQADKSYLESFIDAKKISQKDVKFMLENNQYRFKENKLLTDYIHLNGFEIESDPYYKSEKHFFQDLKYKRFLRLSFPYFSINKKFAIIGYEFICDGLCGNGGKIIFSKNEKQEWIISKKLEEWIE